jgi:hypothetical protein
MVELSSSSSGSFLIAARALITERAAAAAAPKVVTDKRKVRRERASFSLCRGGGASGERALMDALADSRNLALIRFSGGSSCASLDSV